MVIASSLQSYTAPPNYNTPVTTKTPAPQQQDLSSTVSSYAPANPQPKPPAQVSSSLPTSTPIVVSHTTPENTSSTISKNIAATTTQESTADTNPFSAPVSQQTNTNVSTDAVVAQSNADNNVATTSSQAIYSAVANASASTIRGSGVDLVT